MMVTSRSPGRVGPKMKQRASGVEVHFYLAGRNDEGSNHVNVLSRREV